MGPAFIYKNRTTYELAMIMIYGRRYFARYQAIADLIPRESSVLEVCCGPGILYGRYLRSKSVSYTGLDMNRAFIDKLISCGGSGEVRDLRAGDRLPSADYVIMQASLYHFLPDAANIVKQMGAAARVALIVAEPIRNLAQSKIPLVGAISSLLTNAGDGAQPHRFTEQSLDELFFECFESLPETFYIAGGREKVYVFPKKFLDGGSCRATSQSSNGGSTLNVESQYARR